MAYAIAHRAPKLHPALATFLRWTVSFEMVLVLYLYSNLFQPILPTPPVDLTVLLLLAAMGWSGLIIVRDGLYVRGLMLVLAFLPFCFFTALSLGWSLSRTLAYQYLVVLFTVNLWCLAAPALVLAKNCERMLRFFVLMTMMALVIALMGLFIYIRYGSFKFAGWVDAGRIYNTWGRGTTNGAIVLLLIALLSRPGSLRNLVAGSLLGVCVGFLFVSSSRSALLSFVAAALVCFLVYLPRVGRGTVELSRVQLFFFLGAVVVVAVVAHILTSGTEIDTIKRFETLAQQAEDPDMVTGPNRFAYYAASLKLIGQSPIIGHGVGSFSVLFYSREQLGAHPHNIFLEIMVATGFVGLVLFLIPVWLSLRHISLARLRDDPILLCAMMLFASRAVAAMVGADLLTQQPFFLFWGLLVLRPPETASRPPSRARAGHRLVPAGRSALRQRPLAGRRL